MSDVTEAPEPRHRPTTEARKKEELWIGWAYADEGGCGFYRMLDPAQEIDPAFWDRLDHPKAMHTVQVPRDRRQAMCFPALSEDQVAMCDVVIFQRAHDPVTLDRMVRLKRRGCLVVYDIDDAIWTLGPECANPAYPLFTQGNRLELMTSCIQEADLVTASTESLAEELRRWAEHVEVLPNLVQLKRWDEVEAIQRYGRMGREVVIGFAGSATHERDIRMVMPQLVNIDQQYAGRILWRFLGDPQQIWAWAAALRANPVEAYRWTDFPNYPGALTAMQLDIGICPLWPHEFNLHKSAVKAFEYSLAGAAVVASDYGPYSILQHGVDAQLCSMPWQWTRALATLIDDREQRDAQREILTARVRNEFALEGAGRRWVDTYWKHLLRVREQEERWLFHSRKWASPNRAAPIQRMAALERRSAL